jgi:hypothetical protein
MNKPTGDPYAAWAGAEKRLQNAMDTITGLRIEIADKEAEIAAGEAEVEIRRENFEIMTKRLIAKEQELDKLIDKCKILIVAWGNFFFDEKPTCEKDLSDVDKSIDSIAAYLDEKLKVEEK